MAAHRVLVLIENTWIVMYARVISGCFAKCFYCRFIYLEMSYLAPSYEYAYLRNENDKRTGILLAKANKI